MSLDHIKTPMAAALPAAIKRGVDTGAALNGKSLPCEVTEVISAAEVKVKFNVNADPFTLPEVVCSVLMAEFVRVPIQVGDVGLAISASAYLGGNTGAGGGTPSLTQPGNLGALAFLPLGSTAWGSTEEGVLTLYGVEGVTLLDAIGGPASIKITADSIKAELGAASWELADGKVKLDGELIINGVKYLDHTHGGVTTGGGNSGPVT